MKDKDCCCSASNALFETSDYHLPDEKGHFGMYGGRFVSETHWTNWTRRMPVTRMIRNFWPSFAMN